MTADIISADYSTSTPVTEQASQYTNGPVKVFTPEEIAAYVAALEAQ